MAVAQFKKAAASRPQFPRPFFYSSCLNSRKRSLHGRSDCSQLLPNSKRRPLRGRSCGSRLSKKNIILPSKRRPLSRPQLLQLMFANVAVVVIPNCPKVSHYFALPSKRRPLRGCSCCCFQWLPNSRRRPLRGPSCCSQLSKRDPLFCLQKGGRFAPVVVVICCLQKSGRFAPVVAVPPFKKAAASRPQLLQLLFPTVAVVAVPNFPKEFHYFALPSKRRSLSARSCYYLLPSKRRPLSRLQLLFPTMVARFQRAAASRPYNCPKETHYFDCFQKGGRARSCCYLLPSKGGRFAPVVVVICCLKKGGTAIVVVPNCCPMQFKKTAANFFRLVSISNIRLFFLFAICPQSKKLMMMIDGKDNKFPLFVLFCTLFF